MIADSFRYVVSTTLAGVLPNVNRMVAVVQLPINPVRLQSIAMQMGANAASNIRLSIAQRGVLINPGGAVAGGSAQKRQDNGSSSSSSTSTTSQTGQQTGGSSTTNNNGNGLNNPNALNPNSPVATQLLLAPTFTPIAAMAVLDQMNGRLAIPVNALDGEFIVTVQMADGVPNAAAIPPQAGAVPVAPPPAKRQFSSLIPSAAAAPVVPAAGAPAPMVPAAAPLPAAPAPAVPAVPAVPAPQVPAVPAAPAPIVPAPNAIPPVASSPQSDMSGGVIVSMSWVNYMAQVAQNGLPVDVGALMASLSAVETGSPAGAIPPTMPGADLGANLLGGKAKRFNA